MYPNGHYDNKEYPFGKSNNIRKILSEYKKNPTIQEYPQYNTLPGISSNTGNIQRNKCTQMDITTTRNILSENPTI